MAETVSQIEAHIDRTRHELGANLKELENRVEAATDWRHQYRSRPFTFMGVGFVAGAVIGAMIPSGRKSVPRPADVPGRSFRGASAGGDVSTLLKDAVVSLATVWLRAYVSELVSRSRNAERTARHSSRIHEGPEHTTAA
jgi:hypothetical protein